LPPVHLEQPTKNWWVHTHTLLLYSPCCCRFRTDITILLIGFPNMTHPSHPDSYLLLPHCTMLHASANVCSVSLHSTPIPWPHGMNKWPFSP
jgi:hypothetical protein